MIGLTEARDIARLLGDDVAATLADRQTQADSLYAAGEISLLELLETRQRLIDMEATRVDASSASIAPSSGWNRRRPNLRSEMKT